jgi:hypothetical protein
VTGFGEAVVAKRLAAVLLAVILSACAPPAPRSDRGQAIYVDPGSRLVMVTTAARKLPVDPGVAEAGALWRAVTRDLGR